MKIVFLTNCYNHHQAPLAEALWNKTNGDFCFIETQQMTQERKNMGWGEKNYPSYVVPYDCYKSKKHEIQKVINNADVVIMGSAPDELLLERLSHRKLTFRYSERMFKTECPQWQIPLRIVKNYYRFGRHKSEYLLCSSAYTAGDFERVKTFKGKCYKWGYFPEVKRYDVAELMKKKLSVTSAGLKHPQASILWAGRLIGWKHPDASIRVAASLKEKRYSFRMSIIGDGEMKEQLQKMIIDNDLSSRVEMLGSMSPKEVREHMEKADIYLFTSDFNEGWGAVLNEAMNSGCAVVASHAIGSVPFLIRNGENGFVYENGNQEQLEQRVEALLSDQNYRSKLGINAYKTLSETWNADVAAERFIALADLLRAKKDVSNLFLDGPCSVAERINNDWFK